MAVQGLCFLSLLRTNPTEQTKPFSRPTCDAVPGNILASAPHPGGFVPRRGNDARAIWGKGRRDDQGLMAFQGDAIPSAVHTSAPHSGCFVPRRGDDTRAIRGKGRRDDDVFMTFQGDAMPGAILALTPYSGSFVL